MLAKGTSDPYTRFITPDEFESMRKYDVTGVGLHLGTAEEYVRKTGLQLPPGHQESEVMALCASLQNLGPLSRGPGRGGQGWMCSAPGSCLFLRQTALLVQEQSAIGNNWGVILQTYFSTARRLSYILEAAYDTFPRKQPLDTIIQSSRQ